MDKYFSEMREVRIAENAKLNQIVFHQKARRGSRVHYVVSVNMTGMNPFLNGDSHSFYRV